MKEHPFFLAGQWQKSKHKLEVLNPYDGKAVGITFYASPSDLEKAIQSAVKAFQTTRHLSSHERSEILQKITDGIKAYREELARTLTLEVGKPIKDSLVEVDRAVLTFQTASEEAKRIYGEALPLDLNAASKGRWGIVRRFPLGPILAITPFNFPLNLVAHKLAPAIAAGNTILLKPASKTPLIALKLAQIISESGLPEGALSVLPISSELHDKLVSDERFKLLTFTGSSEVGWALKAKAGKKRVLLELGGNAGVIVDAGLKEPQLEYATKRIVIGGFSLAGQSCISVQRIYVHEAIFGEFTEAFVAEVKKLKLGDPLEMDTDLGPMIDKGAAQRTEAWVQEAIREGARVLIGGKAREHNIFEPTILTNTNPKSKVCTHEAFAPLVVLFEFKDFKEAVAEVNNSSYGLQAGVFTPNLEHAFYAFEELEVGGVIINDIPTWRIDPMPYGGVKDSGQGREGLRYAIEEMTERKLMVLNMRC